MATGLIVAYLVVLGVLYFLGRKCWRPLFGAFNLLFRGALGALGIYIFNLLASYWQVSIPLNPFTSIFTGFLGIPGLLSLLVVRYIIRV